MLEITFTYVSTNESHLQFGFSCYTMMTPKMPTYLERENKVKELTDP